MCSFLYQHRHVSWWLKLRTAYCRLNDRNILPKRNKSQSGDKNRPAKLCDECEKVKLAVVFHTKERIGIELFFDGHNFSEILTCAWLEEPTTALSRHLLKPSEDMLEDGGSTQSKAHEVLRVGGVRGTPIIQRVSSDVFNAKDLKNELMLNANTRLEFSAAL